VSNLGAGAVIDFQTQHSEEQVRDADVVNDLVCGETPKRWFQVLRRGRRPFPRYLLPIRMSRDTTESKKYSFGARVTS
jgi:hypothetical protein